MKALNIIKRIIDILSTAQKIISLWLLTCTILLVITINNTPNPNERVLFSDQAVHISMALSIWNDGDLRYTLSDLERFREIMPAESGPRGLFLKIGKEENLYFAKPFIYSLFSAPFVSAFGINGFVIINIICFFIIGIVALLILLPRIGAIYTSLIVFPLMLFSPFAAWLPIAHPDLFIAAMLSIGGYLLLSSKENIIIKFSGSFILGLVLFEKITFILILPFVLFAVIKELRKRELILVVLFIMIGWLMPTIVNLLQDGSLLSYQGTRFYVRGMPYPLEENWVMPVLDSGITGHVFDIKMLISSLFSNIYLLPAKFMDFLIGRQTGLLLYFPSALALLFLVLLKVNIKSGSIVLGLFAYLCAHWIAFPTNGYGGAGSYGSRYLMQALPLIMLAVYYLKKSDFYNNGQLKKYVKSLIIFAGALSVIFQYQVLPPTEKHVKSPSLFLNSSVAQIFPFESSLMPHIKHTMSEKFSSIDDTKNNYIYRTGANDEYGYSLIVEKPTSKADFVLYQTGVKSKFPPLGLFVSKPGGHLVLTTPNVARLENVTRLISGTNIYDPYSGYGPYGRHNREFNRHEVVGLLKFEGFEPEIIFTADVHENNAEKYADLASIAPLVSFRGSDLGQYIFVRARNTEKNAIKRPMWLYRSLPESQLG